jgi:hypothetical protein
MGNAKELLKKEERKTSNSIPMKVIKTMITFSKAIALSDFLIIVISFSLFHFSIWQKEDSVQYSQLWQVCI